VDSQSFLATPAPASGQASGKCTLSAFVTAADVGSSGSVAVMKGDGNSTSGIARHTCL
jgi:hypothetical protein